MTGIYVENISMPHGDELIVITSDGVALLIDKELTTLERSKAIPVPEHGRLIDADALTISTAVPLNGKPYQYVHIDNIKSAPTIIPAEEDKT